MLEQVRKVYMIGVGGISMSAIAQILHSYGIKIYASDINCNKLIEKLINENIITFRKGSCSDYVRKCDAVIYTSAASDDNKDLILARKLKKKIFTRAEVLGELSRHKKTISVAGTHGKTTATGIIAQMLLSAKRNPNIHIGGVLKNISSNVLVTNSDIFVSEACEYKDSFLHLSNFISIVLNIKADHLDYFHDINNEFNSFQKFIDNTSPEGFVILNNDDFLTSKLSSSHKTYTFAIEHNANFKAINIKQYIDGKYSFTALFDEKVLGEIYLPCYGYHNIYNALASIATGVALNIDFKQIKDGIEHFAGIERRFEIIKQNKFLTIIHDYAHHPDEIEATLNLCQSMKPQKLIAIFQPHTYSRTRDLYNQFLSAFDKADEVWLLPIYPAREKPIKDISSFKMKKDMQKRGMKTRYFRSFQACRQEILCQSHDNTTFILLGAGDIVDLAYSFYH